MCSSDLKLSPSIEVVRRYDFVRSVEIRRDLVEIWPDLFEISSDLFEIGPDLVEISLDLFEIGQAFFEIRSDPAKISKFWQKSSAILTIRARPKTDRKTSTSDHPNRCRRRIGDGSIFRRPEVIGSVPGWAQTRPGPTCGQP